MDFLLTHGSFHSLFILMLSGNLKNSKTEYFWPIFEAACRVPERAFESRLYRVDSNTKPYFTELMCAKNVGPGSNVKLLA